MQKKTKSRSPLILLVRTFIDNKYKTYIILKRQKYIIIIKIQLIIHYKFTTR